MSRNVGRKRYDGASASKVVGSVKGFVSCARFMYAIAWFTTREAL